MKCNIPLSAYKDPRDPDYEEFDFDAYYSAMDDEAEREIEERLLGD